MIEISLGIKKKDIIAGYLFILPWIIGFLAFIAFPVIMTLLLGFYEWNLLDPPKLVGVKNYVELFKDPLFWQSLKVTLFYAVLSVPLQLIFALFIALLLERECYGLSIYRALYYLPSVLPGVAVALLWMWIFNPEFGILNFLLWKIFRIQGPAWLSDEHWVIPALVLMSLWGVGGGMIIYLGGLKNIPNQLYEAAELDGCNFWQRFRFITLPMLSPVVFFNVVIGIIGAFQTFTQAYVMTNGGPNNATLFYVLYLYRNAFQYLRMGYASALAWILFLIVLVLTLSVFKSSSIWVYYEGEVRK